MEERINMTMENNSLNSIQHTLRAIIFFSWLLGVGIARPQEYPKIVTIILRIIHFGICTVIVTYGVTDFFGTFGEVFKSDTFKIMYYINKVTCYVSAYYYVYHGIQQYNKWPELMNKIKNLDQKIRRETLVNNRLIKKVEMLTILTTFVCGPLSLIIHVGYYYFTRPQDIFASDLLLYYTITQSLINSFTFDIIVYVLYHRFQTINKLMLQLQKLKFRSTSEITSKFRRIRDSYTEFKIYMGRSIKWNNSEQNSLSRNKTFEDLILGLASFLIPLWTLVKLTRICDLVIMVNEIYGFYLLLCWANCFTMVMDMLFRIYIGFVEKNYTFMLINNILWILYAMQFGLMCWFCTLMRQESDKTGIIIYTIILNKEPPNEEPPEDQDTLSNIMENHRGCLKDEVNDFSIQLQQHRVVITACNFFDINNALLKSFVAVIITHLTVLIQFYQAEHLKA